MRRRLRILSLLTLLALALVSAMGGSPAYGAGKGGLSRINHIVVIYQENHSLDNLYGRWEGVNGLRNAPRAKTIQIDQAGVPYDGLLQNDVNLTSPPLSVRCTGTTPTGTAFSSHFFNRPFTIDRYIAPSDTTCPPPGVFAPNGVPKGQGLPGGCTRDLVHRFYQEQYQLNDGRQNRYVTGSDAVGLAMRVYDTRALPIYRYLHRPGHQRYAIADNFFQAAFGGLFLNHQWLIAASNPVWPGARNDGSADDLSLGGGRQRDAEQLPAVRLAARRRGQGPGPDRLLRPAGGDAADAAGGAVRRLGGQHHPARLPAVRARDAGVAPAPAPDRAHHRRPAERRRRRLGLVLGRLVQRQRRRRRPRLDQRRRTDLLGPQRAGHRRVPQLPRQAVPVPPPAVQLLRELRPGDRRQGGPPARRAGVPRPRQLLGQGLQPQAGELHQARRGRERASRLRQRPHGQQPPDRAAGGGRRQPLRQGHHGRGDLRRVRRPVGPRHPARPGRQAGPARRLRPQHPDPGAGDLAVPAGPLRGRPHPARHDLGPGHHRAPLRPGAAERPRRRRARPVQRVPRQEAPEALENLRLGDLEGDLAPQVLVDGHLARLGQRGVGARDHVVAGVQGLQELGLGDGVAPALDQPPRQHGVGLALQDLLDVAPGRAVVRAVVADLVEDGVADQLAGGGVLEHVLPGALLGVAREHQVGAAHVQDEEHAGVIDHLLEQGGGGQQPGVVADLVEAERLLVVEQLGVGGGPGRVELEGRVEQRLPGRGVDVLGQGE